MALFDSEVTLQKLCYNLGDLTRGGYQSDDEPLSDREKQFIVNGCRATLIIRELGKKTPVLGKIFEQTLFCRSLIVVPYSECCGFDSDTQILRTANKLPKLVYNPKDVDGVAITYVGSGQFGTFQRIDSNRQQFSSFAPRTGKMRKAIFLNDYLYVSSDSQLEEITIRGYFDDPIKAGRASGCTDCTNECIDWTSPYPMPISWNDALNKLAYETDIKMLLSARSDEKNDSSGDIETRQTNG